MKWSFHQLANRAQGEGENEHKESFKPNQSETSQNAKFFQNQSEKREGLARSTSWLSEVKARRLAKRAYGSQASSDSQKPTWQKPSGEERAARKARLCF
jgi:hypothetical protein